MNFETLDQLVNYLQQKGLLDDPGLKQAFLSVDRGDFVKEEFNDQAYFDQPLPIAENQTISQPTTVAFLLNLLDVQKGQRVLDIGAGSGWTSCLLSFLVGDKGRVDAFEINRQVGEVGLKNVKNFNAENINYRIADLSQKIDELPAYDRILSGAAFEKVPDKLLGKLKINGILVIPTQENDIKKITRLAGGDFKQEIFPGFVFVPFVEKSS